MNMPKPVTQRLRLDNFVPYRLSIASNLMSDAIAGAYRSLFGLNVAEWRLIAVLAERSSTTQQEICAATRMDKVTISRAAIALADRGLIDRAPNPGDRRSQLLSLSASGQQLYAQVVPKAMAMEKELLADLTPQEVRTLVDMLRRLEARAESFSESAG